MLPPELDRIVSKSLDKDRGMRYQTAADLGADLKRLRRDSGSRQGITPALSGATIAPDAATVVMPSTAATRSAARPASAARRRLRDQRRADLPPRDPSAVLRNAAKTPWMWGVGGRHRRHCRDRRRARRVFRQSWRARRHTGRSNRRGAHPRRPHRPRHRRPTSRAAAAAATAARSRPPNRPRRGQARRGRRDQAGRGNATAQRVGRTSPARSRRP